VRQDEATRRRYKGTAHLPDGSTFRLAELDLSEVVSAEVMATFEPELRKRAERRRREAEQERRAAAAAEKAEKAARKQHSRSRLALELLRASGRPISHEEAPRIEVDGVYAAAWQAQQAAAAGPTFASMSRWGFAASGSPPSRGLDGSRGLGSPPCSGGLPGAAPSPLPQGAWAARSPTSAPAASPPPLAAPLLPPASAVRIGGASLLHHSQPRTASAAALTVSSSSASASAAGGGGGDDGEEEVPPELAASWAAASSAVPPSGRPSKGGKGKKGVLLLSNAGGGRRI